MRTTTRTRQRHPVAIALLLLALAWARELRAECIRGYTYSAPITITNPGPVTLTDYQVRLEINTARLIAAGKMGRGGADIRFALNGDCCAPLDYWVESGMNSDNTVIWVKIPSLPAAATGIITMFYGNPGAVDAGSPRSVFPLFDEFDGDQIDNERWETRAYSSGRVDVSGGTATFLNGNDSVRGAAVIVSRSAFSTPVIAEMMVSEAHGMWPHMAVQIPGSGLGYGPFLRDRAMLFGVLNPGGNVSYEAQTFLTSSAAGNVDGVWNVSWWATAGESISWPDGYRLNPEPRYAQYDISPTVTVSLGVLGPGPGSLSVEWVRVRSYADPAPTVSAPGPEQIEVSPRIAAQPQSRVICEGMPCTFAVVSDGASFQWRRNGTPIPGATGSSLTITAATAADTGAYDVVVSGGGCGPTITSNAAMLAFNAPAAITAQPEGTIVCAGSPLALGVTATGSGLAYRWRRNGSPIPGATGARFVIPLAATGDAGSYDVMITGACGETIVSAPAAVTVLGAPVVVESPRDTTVCRNMTFTLSADVTGAGLRYQWRRNGAPIPGATSATYSHRAQPYDDGMYDLLVTGRCGAPVATMTARVTVVTEPIIGDGPVSRSVSTGEKVTFSVRASGGGSLRYQWRRDGVDIPGATLPIYTIASASPADIGTYDVVVAGTTCTAMEMVVVSEAAVLAIDAPLAIVADPADMSLCAGRQARFVVSATGSDLRYRWRKDGTPIAGATSPLYRIASVSVADAGSYDVVITGPDGGSIVSAPAMLTLLAPAAITSGPADAAVCTGEPVTLAVSATGDGIGYQWRRDGKAIAGATAASHMIAAATRDDAGRYDVVVTGSCGDTTVSGGALVTVRPVTAITRGPAAARVRAGERVDFSVEATGSDPRYVWEHDGIPIAGADAATYTIERVATSDGGSYRAIVIGRCPPADTSIAATLIVEVTSGIPEMIDDPTGEARLTVLPQPARGSTRLLVTLPGNIHPGPGTRLTLHDGSGREVIDLSESFARGGFTGAELDAVALPSGSYYCRIDTGGWSRLIGVVEVMH